MREDIRSFGNEKVMNPVTSLEGAIYSSTVGSKEYFASVSKAGMYLGEVIEDQLGPKNVTYIPRKQEEIRTQSDI